jgi:hypothetical protein
MDVALTRNHHAYEVQLPRRGKLLNVGSHPSQNTSSVVPKCHSCGLVRPGFCVEAEKKWGR